MNKKDMSFCTNGPSPLTRKKSGQKTKEAAVENAKADPTGFGKKLTKVTGLSTDELDARVNNGE